LRQRPAKTGHPRNVRCHQPDKTQRPDGQRRRALPQLIIASLLGGMLMMLADWAGRMVMFPYQIPAGLLATFIGAPYFVYLLRKQSR
ncbi:iron chelate uptake ABC transporter family permease subunit, partial [Cronobacter sakazakii]|uniref:iron chelate uptake ABC transporter family permease subunit n=1 Tax=Cronobacter sakazakii TaxID=28141 RepID=UPI001EFE5302